MDYWSADNNGRLGWTMVGWSLVSLVVAGFVYGL